MVRFWHQKFSNQQIKVFLPLVMVVLLLAIAKVVLPSALRAQTNLGKLNQPTTTTTTTPPTKTSSTNSIKTVTACQAKTDTKPQLTVENVPTNCQQTSLDISDYVAPKCDNKDCPEVASVFVSASNQRTVLTNQIKWIPNSNYFQQLSGGRPFVYQLDQSSQMVKLVEDNIWDESFTCTNGKKPFYRLYEGSNPSNLSSLGGHIVKTTMGCGETFDRGQQFLVTYEKDDFNSGGTAKLYPDLQTFLNRGSQLKACQVDGQTGIPVQNAIRLLYQGPATCNGKKMDGMIVLTTTGSGGGETYLYCKGYGLCGLYTKLDFNNSKNQPRSWSASTDLCNLTNTNTDTTPYFEYNIQRASTQDVLNNFYDEYSVACVPKATYQLLIENREKCAKTAKGCANWDVTGNLSISSNGKLFGLMRNEAEASSRTGVGAYPNRFESIEGYLGTKNTNEVSSTAVAYTDTNRPTVADVSIYQAPLYKLTTEEQQCQFAMKKLIAVQELCDSKNRIECDVDPVGAKCSLDQPIPTTTYTHSTLFSAVGKPTDIVGACKNIVAKNDDLKKAVLAVPLQMETAYRPAFLVAVTQFQGSNQQGNTLLTSGDAQDNNDFTVVDYMEIKVPAFGSDFVETKTIQDGNKTSATQVNLNRNGYQDPLRITADILQTTKQQEDNRSAIEKARAEVKSNKNRYIGDDGNQKVFCMGQDGIRECKADNDKTHDTDKIPAALVDFINANIGTKKFPTPCEGTQVDFYDKNVAEKIAEQAQQIGSTFDTRDVGRYTKKKEIDTKLKVSVENLDPKAANNNVGINNHTQLYLVTPQGDNLAYAQNSFLNFLTSDQQQGALAKSLISSGNFPLALQANLDDQVISNGVFSQGRDALVVAPVSGQPTPQPPTFTTSMKLAFNNDPDDANKSEPHSLFWKTAGQVASLPTRLMALITSDTGSTMNEYTLGCAQDPSDPSKPNPHATEDWLLGKCQPSAQINTPTTNNTSACIETKISHAQAQIYANQLIANLPGQEDLWQRYFAGYLRGAPLYLYTNTDKNGQTVCSGVAHCYEKIINTAVANNLNPYLAIAISFNETGGLKSNAADASGPHFGCGADGKGGVTIGSVEAKLQCMIGAFNGYEIEGLSGDAALTRYGYTNGFANRNLNTIIGLLSNDNYSGACQ